MLWLLRIVVLTAVCTGTLLASRPPAVFIIGDSTVANRTPKLMGWGDSIGELFDPARIHVENRARGGRSSRTFLAEGLWQKVVDDIRPGDFVLIQFGHNDGGSLTEGRARASLKGNGEEAQEVSKDGTPEAVHTYGSRRCRGISGRKGAWRERAITAAGLPRRHA